MSFIFVCALLFPLISAGEFSLQDPFPSHFSAFRSLLLRVFSFHFDICYILQPSHLKIVGSSILPLNRELNWRQNFFKEWPCFSYMLKRILPLSGRSWQWLRWNLQDISLCLMKIVLERLTRCLQFDFYHIFNKNAFVCSVITQ